MVDLAIPEQRRSPYVMPGTPMVLVPAATMDEVVAGLNAAQELILTLQAQVDDLKTEVAVMKGAP